LSKSNNNYPFEEEPSPSTSNVRNGGVGMRGGGRDPFAREMKMKQKPTFGKVAPISNNSGGGGNNPFNEGGPPPPVPKAMISSAPTPFNTAAGAGGSNNPFDAAGGAGRVPKNPTNRWNNNSRSMNDTDSTRPILTGMDEESIVTTNNNNISSNNAATLNNNISSNAAGLASWLRLNKKEDDGPHNQQQKHSNDHFETSSFHTNNNNHNASKSGGPPNAIHNKAKKYNTNVNKPKKSKTKAFVTPWPYDNYHEVQEQMYEELASQAAASAAAGGGSGEGGGYHSGDDDDEKKEDMSRRRRNHRQQHTVTTAAADDSQYYERPEELPSIKEAVTDLPLVDFEKKAEDRAVNIVSTWLFDAGLIDELLVNGAMNIGMNNTQSSSKVPSSSHSVMSEKTSEGQEIGLHGFPLVGAEGAELKMDKETNKLRAMIQRDLSIINARLNDGVAASGLEVQELVNAVSATKDDIGRLRELTTYISDGQISDRDEFLLAKYPYMRKAINARRNINRTFRELEFFSQIPSTCDRLRDDLHGGEWTAEEWSTIRNVSMEHVELEIMLVEAENNMKSSQHNFNVAMVDNFLSAHVQNVWELGDEIRMRIISGIGSAFDLSINNPAGMVALVEAVEVYERAAESFEKKRKERGDSGKLRFTNMRAAALEQLYQDFELRGVEMFRGVHEHAADIADEYDAGNTQFTAVLKAATELVSEIDIVKHQMSPCVAQHSR